MIYTDGVHVVSDTSIEELHAFAVAAGIKRCWFHAGAKHPHYDIPKRRRATFALEQGIKVVTSKEIIKIVNSMPE